MGLHVAALLTGAAVGGLVTYMAKDERARKAVEDFIDGSGAAFTRFLERVTPNKDSAAETAAVHDGAQVGQQAGAPADRPAADNEPAMH